MGDWIAEKVDKSMQQLADIIPCAEEAGFKFGNVKMKAGAKSAITLKISAKYGKSWDDVKMKLKLKVDKFGEIIIGILKQIDVLRKKCGNVTATVSIVFNIMHGGIPEPTLSMSFGVDAAQKITKSYGCDADGDDDSDNDGDNDEGDEKDNEEKSDEADDDNKDDEEKDDDENKDKTSPQTPKKDKKKKKKKKTKTDKRMEKFNEWVGRKVDDLMGQIKILAPAMTKAGIEISDITLRIGAESGFALTIKTKKSDGRWDENLIENKDEMIIVGKVIMIALMNIDKVKQRVSGLSATIELVLKYGAIPSPKLNLSFSPKSPKYFKNQDDDNDEKDESQEEHSDDDDDDDDDDE